MVVHEFVTSVRHSRWALWTTAALAAVLVAGCSAAAPTPQIIYVTAPPIVQPTPQIVYVTPVPAPSAAPLSPAAHTITGTITLIGASWSPIYAVTGDYCTPTQGYQDITDGAPVSAKDGAGTLVGLGQVQGKPALTSTGCVFGFTIAGVLDTPFYTIGIGKRAGPSFSNADLVARGWIVALTLGG